MLDLSRLTAAQRAVVLAGDGPLVVVAGPGSGKTTTLAARIAYLVLARGVPPAGVLALSFAARAARELRSRLAGLLGPAGRGVEVVTFHGFGLGVLRRWGDVLGWGPGTLAVYGTDEVRALVGEVAAGLGLDPSIHPAREVAAQMERYRLGADGSQDGAVAGGFPGSLGGPGAAGPAGPAGTPAGTSGALPAGVLAELTGRYESALRQRCAVDFAAMLTLPLRLCAARPDVLLELQDRHRHVLRLVGDPRQAIYGFRGADAGLMLHLHLDFPEARTLHLEHNFRATGHLVALANALGAALPYGQRLRTDNPPGEAGRLHAAADEPGEAEFVAAEVARLCAAGRLRRLGEAGVLFRTRRQADPLALALRRRRVPYRVQGSTDLLARPEVRDAVAYLRLAHNPDDRAALARVVNVPPRRLARVAAALRAAPPAVSLLDLPSLATPDGPAAAAAARRLVALVLGLHAASRDRAPAELLAAALDGSGYRAWLAGLRDRAERETGLTALLALARQAGGDGLESWLADLQLGEDADGGPDAGERLLLSTVHGAKGGEWRIVFVLGMEEGLLPHASAVAAARGSPASGTRGGALSESLAEELRLAYVAVTRAREVLYVTHCRSRRRGDRVEPRRPSRFLEGLPLATVPGARAGPTGAGTLRCP